ncbi:MAG TPA: 5'-methylthioadenosine/adenosylhomocysteine nucleosidase [Puia sp.]|nr:5'-methylthioadenosine/adenosylhomocysteine nucleosidase [Puia sp.]
MTDYFQLKKNNTTLSTELIAGLSSFLATAYIIVVNPAILSQTGMPFAAVSTATILVCFFSSLMMGLYARNPILVAPGMGLNAFFTFSVVLGMKVPWQQALGAVFWSGIIFLLLSLFNIRTYIVQAIPRPLRYGIAAGIGLFITLIGLVNARFIVHNPATMVGMGTLNAPVLTFIAGLLLMAILIARKVKGAILMGIAFTTIAALPLGRWWGMETGSPLVSWKGLVASPDFSLLFQLDLVHSLQWAVAPVIFAFVFTDMFDSLSTFVGLAEAANLLDEKGEPRQVRRSLLTDAVSTTLAGLLGSSPGTAYIESAVGIEAGGRTGLTAVVGGLLFLPFLFLAPLLSVVPAIATAPALVLVGVFMIRPVIKINWQQLDEAIPAFLAMVLIPFTYSITEGIIWGFLSWTVLKIVTGKKGELSPALLVIDGFAILALALTPPSAPPLSPASPRSSVSPLSSAPQSSQPLSSPSQPVTTISSPTNPVTAILGAFPAEITILREQMKEKKDTLIQQVQFTRGFLNGRRVVLAQTGMGKANAAMTTTLMLEHFHPRELLFTGIAGGVNPHLSPGDLVIGTAVTYHDYGTLTPDSLQPRATHNPFTGQDNPLFFTCDTGLVQTARRVSRQVAFAKINDGKGGRLPAVAEGVIVTGDVFVASLPATQKFRRQLAAQATEMEGAAIGQVCWQQRVPFLVIRSLSDNASSNAASEVHTFYQVAANNSASLIIAMAAALHQQE